MNVYFQQNCVFVTIFYKQVWRMRERNEQIHTDNKYIHGRLVA